MPTATDDDLGLDQWTLGPEVILAMVGKWGTLGIIASHQWDVAGDNKADTSITSGQYFCNLNLKKGWVFGAGPTFSYNHEAESRNKLTLPLGIGLHGQLSWAVSRGNSESSTGTTSKRRTCLARSICSDASRCRLSSSCPGRTQFAANGAGLMFLVHGSLCANKSGIFWGYDLFFQHRDTTCRMSVYKWLMTNPASRARRASPAWVIGGPCSAGLVPALLPVQGARGSRSSHDRSVLFEVRARGAV